MNQELSLRASLQVLPATKAVVTGPVGCGKSTILKMLAQELKSHPVVALQLMPDNSIGYTGVGALEVCTVEDFKKAASGLTPGSSPVLIIDGLTSLQNPSELASWLSDLDGMATMAILCASTDIEVAANFMDKISDYSTIRVYETTTQGYANGIVKRAPDEIPSYWELRLESYDSILRGEIE